MRDHVTVTDIENIFTLRVQGAQMDLIYYNTQSIGRSGLSLIRSNQPQRIIWKYAYI